MNDVALDMYIAGYDDYEAAKNDFDTLRTAQREDRVVLLGGIIVGRDADGGLHVKDSSEHGFREGAGVGVAGGFVLGLLAPPLVPAMLVGGLIGGVARKLVTHHEEMGIATAVEDAIPPGTYAVVTVIDRYWTDEVARDLSGARRTATRPADKQTVDEFKAALEKAAD